jgi:UDP-N-acetylglucosamine 2-epimerase (non-hydrolysing)
MKKIVCVIGTRPEAIKMAPVILALKKSKWAEVRVLVTGQHREMLDQVLRIFKISADIDLNLMKENQSLPELTSRLIVTVSNVLESEAPDVVLVQGDTTTVFASALAAFYKKIPFGHIEAGLRTNDMGNPFPEEANRVLTGRLANWHFAPTITAKKNLILEGIPEKNILVTGNTVIDALKLISDLNNEIFIPFDKNKKIILFTCHRRENFGDPFKHICKAIVEIAREYLDQIEIIFPVHPNPNISKVAHEFLGNVKNVILCKPLDYVDFVTVLKKSYLVITDSGGVQEEAPFLGKPVLVLRGETERPEAVEIGVAKLIGCNQDNIISEVRRILSDDSAYLKMSKGGSPYGDGKASSRIIQTLQNYFNESN